MFSLMIVLAIVSSFLELVIINIIKPLKKLYNYNPPGKPPYGMAANMIGSIMLSYFVGKGFGAEGLIAMGAGMMSTAMSVIYLKGEQLMKHRSGTSAGDGIRQMQEGAKLWWEQYGQLLRDLWTVIVVLIKIITWPLRKYRTIRDWVVIQRERIAH